MQAMLTEMNRRHQQMLKQQEREFQAQLTNQQNTSIADTLNWLKSNASVVCNSQSAEKLADSSRLSRANHSHTNLHSNTNWDRDHFRQILNKQQSKIKSSLTRRQNTSQRKIFDYSSNIPRDQNHHQNTNFCSPDLSNASKPSKDPNLSKIETSTTLNLLSKLPPRG